MNIPDLNQTQGKPDLSKAKVMKCKKCEGSTFKQTVMLYTLSALVSPNGQETIVPTAVFACDKCSYVDEIFLSGE